MIFDIEFDFESQILALFDSSPLIQNSKFNNLYPSFENSTTRNATMGSFLLIGVNFRNFHQLLNLDYSYLLTKNIFIHEFIIFQVLSYLEKKKDMAKNC